ncbi:hypothetical protein [Sporosalibacterium faouarense]|uniref:hypothetical protein n=1 Tax=Sporosalibacterium faouarense TaxID=516123 RepID=UPI00141CFA8D|nr:hypothetical protein [Sporosalibacterium faouarense]MTI49577.1 hypothetical protein [Bacillota bacterium]
MAWKKGKVRFDDGTEYKADLLVHNGEVWNMKVYKDGQTIQQIDADSFASKLGRTPETIYPFTYDIEE